jgi:hypothetical protein
MSSLFSILSIYYILLTLSFVESPTFQAQLKGKSTVYEMVRQEELCYKEILKLLLGEWGGGSFTNV